MIPLRRLELRLLRECARMLRSARRRSLASITYAANQDNRPRLEGFAWQDLISASILAEQYLDLRDARKILNHFAENAGICEVCGLHCRYDGHASGCALERVTRDG